MTAGKEKPDKWVTSKAHLISRQGTRLLTGQKLSANLSSPLSK
jgi:hypothetical protein